MIINKCISNTIARGTLATLLVIGGIEVGAQTCVNVGIGTTSPNSKLEIRGCGDDSTTSSLNVTDSSGTSLFYIRDNKRLGINTTNPRTTLHIESGANGGINLNNTAGDPRLGFYLNSIVTPRFVLGVDSSDAMKFKIGTSSLTTNTRLTIDSTGNIGIGTSAPSSLLDIESAASSDGIDINNTATDGDPQIAFQLSGTSKFTFGVDDGDGDQFKIGTTALGTDTRMIIDSNGRVGIGTNPGVYKFSIRAGTMSATTGFKMENADASNSFRIWAGTSGNILNATGSNSIVFSTDGVQRMYLDDAFKIGIGTSSPNELLDVRGASTFNSGLLNKDFRIAGNNEANLFFIDASAGNIGIGTNTPSALLDVESDAAGEDGIDINSTATDGDPRIAFQLSDTTLFTIGVDDSDGNKFKIGTSSITTNTRITLDTNGFVGIGTTNPSYQLHLSLDSAAKPSSSFWTTTSDQRVKKDIVPFTDGQEVLNQIIPVRYKYNGLAGTPNDNREQIGVIAQQMDTVASYFVKPIKSIVKGSEADNFPGDKRRIGTDTLYHVVRTDTVRNGLHEKLVPIYTTEVLDVYEGTLNGFDAHALFFLHINACKEMDVELQEIERRIASLEAQ